MSNGGFGGIHAAPARRARAADGCSVILYLHGFRSSPASRKAQLLRQTHARRTVARPSTAVRSCRHRRARAIEVAAAPAGRSGQPEDAGADRLFARRLLRDLARRTASAAVRYCSIPRFARRTICARISARSRSTSPTPASTSGPSILDELAAIDTPAITRPERYFLLAATGDAVIDYRTMMRKYAGARQHVIAGSDHELSDFASIPRRGAARSATGRSLTT